MLWFSCENPAEPDVYGCTNDTACNFNPDANIFDDTCIYEEDCNGECGGDAVLDNCDVCDNDTSNDCEQDDCGVWGGDGVDIDNDGICDDVDDCPLDPDNDLDDDGICDDIDDCIPIDLDGMKIVEMIDGEEGLLYSECNGVIDNNFQSGIPSGNEWNLTVHFLDDECEELCELPDEAYLEISGYDESIISISIGDGDPSTFVVETIAPGETTFEVRLMNQGHSSYNSLTITIVVE